MPVEAYSSHENQRQPKRRRGIAQLSLSSLHSAETFHVNHNHLGNELSVSGVETIEAPRDYEVVPKDEIIGGNRNSCTTQLSPVEKLARLRRRRRKRIDTAFEESERKEQTQQNEIEKTEATRPTMNTHSNKRPSFTSPDDHLVIGKNGVDMFEIEEICSVGYFRATPLNEFRQISRKAFKRTLQSCSNMKDNGILPSFGLIQYDRLEIIRRITNDIDWKSLCEHHDKREYKKKHVPDGRSSKTALSEVTLAMMDRTVIPSCCQAKCLIEIFLNALLMSPSMSVSLQKRRKVNAQKYSSTAMQRWTPSQQLLLKTIRGLLLSQGMSMNPCVSDYVRNFVVFRPPCLSKLERGTNTTSTSILSPNKVNRLLSAIYWLLSTSISPPFFPIHLETDLVSSGLLLLQRIDGWSIQIDAQSQEKDKDSLCLFCKKNGSDPCTTYGNESRRYINRKMTVGALSDLHDEAIDIESNIAQKSYNNNMPWRRFGNNPKKLSLKDILTMKQSEGAGSVTKCTCRENYESSKKKNREAASATSIWVLPSDWSTVCSRAYKKFLSYSAERRQQQHSNELSSNQHTTSRAFAKRNSDEGFLEWLVNDAVLHYGSSSRRVCIALVAHSFGGPKNPFYFKYVAQLFWKGYLLSRQQNELSSQWLRLYCEWLSDCVVFDQPEIAWEALQPILQHITAILAPSEQEQIDINDEMNNPIDHIDVKQEDNSNVNAPLMACVGYILHRRSYLFRSSRVNKCLTSTHKNHSISESTLEEEFQSFVNLLSIYCGEDSELWLSLFSDSTRVLVESTLQRLGVLSISIRDSEGETKDNKTGLRTLDVSISDMSMKVGATSDWPFCEEFGLRRAMRRVDQGVLSLENGIHPERLLLPTWSTDCLNVDKKRKVDTRSSKKLVSSVPMMNYLHDGGILSLIFSFCDSKPLSKVPLVCKTWKVVSDTVSNSLWENAYVSRFGKYRWPCLEAEQRHRTSTSAISTVDSKCSSKKTENTRWKNLFAQKQIAEKMIRFKRNARSGYKYRTCNYLGCLHVLKTSEQEQKHDEMHLRRLAKQQAKLQKKQLRRKKATKSEGRK